MERLFSQRENLWGDIDKKILFEEDRIKTFYLDQLNTEATSIFWQNVGKDNFDLMIEDGLHTFEAGTTLFINSIHYLSKTGIYVIEEFLSRDLIRYKNFFGKSDDRVDYVTMFRPRVCLGDNSLIVVQYNL